MKLPWPLPAWVAVATVMATVVAACASPPAQLAPQVEARFPHDREAFTQGLLLENGLLYESTGLYGRSSLREVDPASGAVIRMRDLDPGLFGEGLALVGDRLIQLTWRAGLALVYDLETFEPLGSFRYRGEGWGLCYDGEELWMSNGSSSLTVRDADTFEVRRRVPVTAQGEPVARLNELECVGPHVYANVWQTDSIVRIDKSSGRVDALVDASRLLTGDTRAGLSADAVLNGIAYDADDDLFLVTGKLWPLLFAVRFD
ncbi:MAG: glutaminyl-peptide cyclotransferase [Trueperaceae bacterium]